MISPTPQEEQDMKSYIKERSNYWDICRQLVRNDFVIALADAYREIELVSTERDGRELWNFVTKKVDESHPRMNLLNNSILAQKIVCADILAKMGGKTLFPSSDWIQQLAFIQSSKMIEMIRRKDGYSVPTPEQIERKQKEANRRKAVEEDIARLTESLEKDKIELARPSTKNKSYWTQRVEDLEDKIKQVQDSGEPLTSVRFETK